MNIVKYVSMGNKYFNSDSMSTVYYDMHEYR